MENPFANRIAELARRTTSFLFMKGNGIFPGAILSQVGGI